MTDQDPERLLVRRAARSVTVLTALAVAAVVLAMAAVVLLLDEHQQHVQANRVSRTAWVGADDVTDPPAQTWLVIQSRDGRRKVTEGAPAPIAALIPAGLPDGITRTVRGGRELVVYTGEQKLGRVSAVYDLSPQEVEERRLQISLAVACVLGALGGAGIGALIGRRAVRPLGAALALQRRFVADASHELRTPLSVLLLRTQMLRRGLPDAAPPRLVDGLDRVVHDTKVLGDVVTDMLSSVELTQQPQRGRPVDLSVLCADVVAELQPLAHERGVKLVARGSGGALVATGVETALRRAVVSLIDNAIAHTPAGGNVRVTAEPVDDGLMITVLDDGEGFDPATTDLLVERFSRGTSTGGGRRFGLGLALVDEVARAHGGRLRVTAEPGNGAEFALTLPALRNL